MDPETKAREKAENTTRIRKEAEEMLAEDFASLDFVSCQAWHGRLRSKIVEMQTLTIKGLFEFAVQRELEAKLVRKIHEVEDRAHAIQSGAGRAIPGKADRQLPPR